MALLSRHLSIRNQLLLLVLLVLLPPAAFIAWHVVDDSRQARNAAHAAVRIIAADVAADLDLVLRDQEELLGQVAAEFRGNPPARARQFDPEQFMRFHPQLANLGVRDLRANNIYSHQPHPTPPDKALKFPWVAQGLRSEAFAISDAFLGTLSGRWVTVMTYPVRDDAGRRSGFVNFSLELLALNRRVLDTVPGNAVVAVLDRQGRFLLRSADPGSWIGRPLPAPQAEAIRGMGEGFISTRGVDGVSRLYAGVTMARTGWRVVVGLPEDEVFAAYRETLIHGVAIGLVALLLVLALARWISAAIARPIRDLAGTAGKIAGGELAARVGVGGPAEIRYVAQQFNGMLDALQRQREERAALVGHFEQLVRLTRDIFLLFDPSGNIVEANDAAVAAYGYSADALRGMNIRGLLAAQAQAALEQNWQATTRPGGALYESVHQRRDGSTFPVEVSSQTFDIEGKLYRQSFVRDISERREAEMQIRRLNRTYATLSETNQAIVRLRDVNELFPRICRIAVEFGGYAGAWVGLVDEPSRSVVTAAVEGGVADYMRQIRISTDPARPEGQGPAALALREGRPYYCRDFLDDPSTEPWRALAAQFGVRSMAALPLRRAGAVIGTLNLYAAEPSVFDIPTQALLEEMAADVSFALDNFEREAARRQAEQALVQSEARYRGIIETAHDAFILIGAGGELLDTNNAASRLTGYSREQLLQMTLRDLDAGKSGEEIARTIADVAAAGHLRFERTLRHRDGRLVDIEISSTYVGTDHGGRFFAFIHDITRRKQSEQALREGEERFRGILEQNVSAVFVVEKGKLAYVNRRAAEILGYTVEELSGRDTIDLIAAPDRQGMAEAMRQLLSGERKMAERSFGALRKDGSVADLGGQAILATLQGKKVVLGMAQDIGERKKAQAEIDDYIGRLERAMESTLHAVSTMVELRDPYTAGHEHRVGELAAAIGAEMGLPAATVKGLRLAGYVHDIGKISVPAEILSKPSQLTPMEFELIKGHSQSGHDVLKDVDFPWPVAEVILQHHERLDGSGYPRQLKDAQILLEARIMAVADVVEAMSSHRPYRPGRGLDAALEEVEKNSGKTYDARAVEACLRLFRDRGYKLPA